MKQHDPDQVAHVERETWDRASGNYLDHGAKLTGQVAKLLIEPARLGVGDRALEVGCGPGHVSKMLADTGASVTGVDLAPRMIEVARREYPNVEFSEANVEDLPFDDDSFDAVLVNYCIHHFARPDRACSQIHRVLKRGGRFVFGGPIEQFSFGAFIQGLMAHHTLEELPHGPIYVGATQGDYEQLVAGAGFQQFDVQTREVLLQFENLEPLLLTGWEMCQLAELPSETQARIREATIDNAAPFKTEAGYVFPDRVVVGMATK